MSELYYRIEPQETKFVRLRLEERGASCKRILYLSTLKEVAKEVDREALAFLTKAKMRASCGQSPETTSFQQIDLDSKNASEGLTLALATGRLLFGSAPVKQCYKGELQWEGELLGGQGCSIRAVLWIGRKVFLSECSWFILSQEKVCAVVDGALVLAPYSMEGKWLERARSGPFVLSGGEYKRFLEEEPKISWNRREEAPLEVLPRLMLHDPMGCFAELWMDYPKVGSLVFSDLSPVVGGRKRLKSEEASLERDLLEAGFVAKRVERSSYYCPGDKIADALSLLLDVGWNIRTMQGEKVVRYSEWQCELKERGSELVLSPTPQTRAVLKAIQEGRAWIEMGNQQAGWIDRKAALKLFGPVLDGEWVEDELRLPKERLSSCLGLLEEKAIVWPKQLREAASQLCAGALAERSEPGEEFKGKLLSYQQEGVDFLSLIHRFGFGGLLADEMGLGKTVQMLALFSRIRTNLPILVVAPTSLLFNWQAEFRRFLPNVQVMLHAGAAREAQVSRLQASPFLLTSYALLRQDEALFKQLELEVVVFDESNAIKNFGTRIFESASNLKAKARFCISGTPIENRVEELAAQFSVLMPKLLSKGDTVDLIKVKTRPFLKRRRKCDVELELPEKIDQCVWIEMTEEQNKAYEEMKEGALKRLKPLIAQDGASRHRMEILEAILRLRQICCDPRLIGINACGAKLDQLMIDVEGFMEEGGKALLYSQFTSMLDLIERACKERGWILFRIDGSTPAQERAKAVQDFQKAEGAALFLLSLKAGGVGLNLTAADTVFLFDPWWNEAVERQAIDRAHRIGRKRTVFVKRYLTVHSIEERMCGLKSAKQQEADQILEEDTSVLGLCADEWLDLLTNS